MTHAPPLDQRIVDEYFNLASHRNTRATAWLYGMVATYGIKPDELFTQSFEWLGTSIMLKNKKRPIRPLHPQWVLLFQLKEKQPHNMWSCWESMCFNLYKAMAHQKIQVNVTDLLLGYRIRKGYYKKIKQPLEAARSVAAVS